MASLWLRTPLLHIGSLRETLPFLALPPTFCQRLMPLALVLLEDEALRLCAFFGAAEYVTVRRPFVTAFQ